MPTIKKIELRSGKTVYRFTVDVGRDPVTGKRDQDTITRSTLRDARAELARIQNEVGRGTYVRTTDVTVDAFLDEYLTSATRDVEKGTAANYGAALLPVRERLGARRLQSLTERDVDDLVDWMLTSGRKRGGRPGTGLSARSVGLTLGRFRSALKLAVRRQLIVRNVAEDTVIPRAARKAQAEQRAARQPWTADELKAFLTGIRGGRLFAPMLLACMGLRPAEVCGLRWAQDVDLDAGTIAAGANTRTLVNGEVVEKDAKSAAGDRPLPVPAPVTVALKAFKVQQTAERLAAGAAYVDTGYVLVDELGQPYKTDQFRRRYKKLVEQTGVRPVRLYDARHACLTYLAAKGVPDVVVSAWAGHADLSFTKRTYIHPDASHLRAAADQLDELLG